jgi:hypothetical protein
MSITGSELSRRGFLQMTAPALIGGAHLASGNPQTASATGQAPQEHRVELPRISASTEQQQDAPALPWPPDQRVGFATVRATRRDAFRGHDPEML